MSRRRLIEILVAAGIVLLLVSVFLVRPTARRTEPPPAPLFHRVEGPLPDFTTEDGLGRVTAASPDRSRTALLYPVEFEETADLFVLTGPGEGTRFALADSLRATMTPKNVGWLDDRTLWVTVGWRYGTVSPGGDLHVLDPETGEGRIAWVSPDSGRTQALAAAADPDGDWMSVRLKVFDEIMLASRDTLVRLPRPIVEAPEAAGAR